MSVAQRKRRVGATHRPAVRRRACVTDLVSVLIDGVIYSSYLFIIAVGLLGTPMSRPRWSVRGSTPD